VSLGKKGTKSLEEHTDFIFRASSPGKLLHPEDDPSKC